MSDDVDRASEREAIAREDALRDQARRAGLQNKTVADSAKVCQARGCGEPIPQARRKALPGCQLCVACQQRAEKRRGIV